jgi:HAE1 family hydrophobic/amphiphilic exporter-1
MLVFAVLLLGFISFRKLGVDLFPDLNNPKIFVEVEAGERPPEEMETQLVDPIESLAIRQSHVLQVSSISRVGSGLITVEYEWDTDMDEAFLDLQKSLTGYGQSEEIDELTISQYDPNATPILLIGLSHETITDMDELRQIAENYIRNEWVRLEGIADVALSGQEEKEVVIETDSYLLEAHSLTADQVASRISEFNRSVSGGSIVEMGLKYIVKGVGVFSSIEDFRNLIMTYDEPEEAGSGTDPIPVFLKDVARVEFRNKDPENIVRVNQKRCIGLSVYKETKYNTVKAVNTLMDALGQMEKALPGYSFTVIQNQGDFVNQAINEVKQSALLGIILAVLVLYVFLRRIGITAIISTAIPISVVATFNLMYFNGLTLNIMTLGGLALGAGMLVDNAIVVMENIFRKMESGDSLRKASIDGTAQVGGAITASTITTIAVFLPIVYIQGVSSELFRTMAWTVAFALLSSLAVAILVIPMLSTRLLRKTPKAIRVSSIQFTGYSRFLGKVLNRRWRVLLGAGVMVVISLLLLPHIGSSFIPKVESDSISLQLTLPQGTVLSRTEKTVDTVEEIIHSVLGEDVETLYTHIGPESGSEEEEEVFQEENSAMLIVNLKKERRISSGEAVARVGAAIREIPDLEVKFLQNQSALQAAMGTDEDPVVVEISGEELDQIEALTSQVKEKMLSIGDLFDIETSFEEGAPEIEVVIDRLQAGLHDMDVSSATSQIKDQLMGKETSQWDHEGELKDVTLLLPRVSVTQFNDITLRSGGEQMMLDEIAEIRVGQAPREIHRRNQIRIGRVTSQLRKGRPFDHVVRQIQQEIDGIAFPQGYRAEITGEEQKRREAWESLTFALILSVILVYMVLASKFESLIHPFTIMLTVPLAAIGAIFMFFITGQSLNVMAYIGLIMLIGIAVNDSIILVDAINQLKTRGLPVRDAIIAAGQRRIRPIVMTSLTTILALIPLTFGFGEGAALRSPMALAVIGGLVTSTLLTLIVIPCVYSVMDQAREWISSRLK